MYYILYYKFIFIRFFKDLERSVAHFLLPVIRIYSNNFDDCSKISKDAQLNSTSKSRV